MKMANDGNKCYVMLCYVMLCLIREELNIEPHCETANQSKAQHLAAL